MRILLDTHLVLWVLSGSRKLPREARAMLLDVGNDVYFSAASVWEVAIKSGLRRKDFNVDPGTLVKALSETGFEELPVSAAHAARVAKLAPIHRDPFDRILVAQSLVEPMTLLTNDAPLARYGATILAV